MNTVVPRATAVVLFVLLGACGSSGTTSPTGPSPTGPSQPTAFSPTPQPSTNFPPLSGPSRSFTFDRELSLPVSGYTKESRFVLYDNGAFVLQYLGLAAQYPGGYTEANGVIFSTLAVHGARRARSKAIR